MNLGTDFDVLTQVYQWLCDGKRPYLFTVIETWGSSPRPVGAHMALEPESGQIAGSVSGGCVEEELLAMVRQHDIPDQPVFECVFGDSPDQAARLQLPCNSILRIVGERPDDTAQLQTILRSITERDCLERELNLVTGEVKLNKAVSAFNESTVLEEGLVKKIYGPLWELMVIGATDIARYLADFAPSLGYRMTVCEPRESYRNTWDLAQIQLDSGMPDDVVVARVNHARFAVLALTHDLKLDDMALLTALESPAFYVGAIGSKKTDAARRERLALLDMPAAAINRLKGPVGLPIGSKSPPEIAISILAELVKIRSIK